MEAKLKDVVSVKGESVQSIPGDWTVLAAVNQMHRQQIGALLVVENDSLKGIFTERDVLLRVVNDDLDPTTTLVSQVMTKDPFCVSPDLPVKNALGEVTERRIRHLPMVDDGGKLVGLVSSGDLNRYLTMHYGEEIRELTQDVQTEGFKFKVTLALVALFIALAIIGVLTN